MKKKKQTTSISAQARGIRANEDDDEGTEAMNGGPNSPTAGDYARAAAAE